MEHCDTTVQKCDSTVIIVTPQWRWRTVTPQWSNGDTIVKQCETRVEPCDSTVEHCEITVELFDTTIKDVTP